MYYAQIKKIESHVIKDHEEYSMIAFHLNAEGKLSAETQETAEALARHCKYTHAFCACQHQQTNSMIATKQSWYLTLAMHDIQS